MLIAYVECCGGLLYSNSARAVPVSAQGIFLKVDEAGGSGYRKGLSQTFCAVQ
jgi:hypothetical protein